MASYSSQTVAQLKELLKAKGLSLAGVKSDLVARLEESDNAVAVEEPAAETTLEPVPVEEPAPVEAPVEAKEETVTETKETEEKPESKPELTLEEKKQAAIEFLTAKIKRAQKFGDEASTKLSEAELKRIEKFGLNLSSDTAFELGFGVRDKNFQFGNKKRFHGKGKRSRNRNRK